MSSSSSKIVATFLTGLLLNSLPSLAAITLPAVFGDHMVLQQGMPAPVWGTADPNEQITITFRDQTKTATADAQGKWMVKLDPLTVGDATTLTVAGSNTITLKDVLVGEVWVGSGQSNIDSPVQMYVDHDPVLNEAWNKDYPLIRLYHPQAGGGWQLAAKEPARGFSAELFYFGIKLQQSLNVPVGLVEAAIQGSPSANWITKETVDSDPGIQAAIAGHENYDPYVNEKKKWDDQMAIWTKNVEAALAAANPSPDATGATATSTPPSLDHLPPDIDKKFPKPWLPPRSGETRGGLGDFYAQWIQPLMPFAIKGVLWDQGEGGTNIAFVDQDVVMHALIAQWRKDWGQGDFPWVYLQKPSGEGCALNADDPINVGCRAFQPNLPQNPANNPGGRFDYINILKQNPNAYIVTTTDLAVGVHPPNKSGYGTRDSQVVLGAVYKQPVEYYGPMYDSFTIEGNKLRLAFTHTGKGLTTIPNQKLQGFSIAGADKNFHWADATINGQTVVLSSPNVPNPVAARYAYDWSITWADLFNADGLPALTFRTDSWGW